jgi:hypothetical protein
MTNDQSSSAVSLEVIRLRKRIEELKTALREIIAATDPDPINENYRADDREGCLDHVFATARAALGEEQQP